MLPFHVFEEVAIKGYRVRMQPYISVDSPLSFPRPLTISISVAMRRRTGPAHSSEIPYSVTTANDRSLVYDDVGSYGLLRIRVARLMKKMGLHCSCPADVSLSPLCDYILAHTTADKNLRGHTEKMEALTSLYQSVRYRLGNDELRIPESFLERLTNERLGIDEIEDARSREYAQVATSYIRWKVIRDEEHKSLCRRGRSHCDWSYDSTEPSSLQLSQRPRIRAAIPDARHALNKCWSGFESRYLDKEDEYDHLDLDESNDNWKPSRYRRSRGR